MWPDLVWAVEVERSSWSVSSVVEHFVHTEGVVGSNPIPTTNALMLVSRAFSTALVLVGLGLMGIGSIIMFSSYWILFRQAWRKSDRRTAMLKVLHLAPHPYADWPNGTVEAKRVVVGALCGLCGCMMWLVYIFLCDGKCVGN